ncbi:hypothetical protein JOS77_22920 [Chromobacterium haemolyticum]|nr:hypothetical protein JOS77_22920 [Chromobacterium haemolyticum]
MAVLHGDRDQEYQQGQFNDTKQVTHDLARFVCRSASLNDSPAQPKLEFQPRKEKAPQKAALWIR